MKKVTALTLLALLAAIAPSQALPEESNAEEPADVAHLSAPVADEIPVALLVDLSSGQTLFARNAGTRFVPASVTKVMTAYTAFELIEQGKLLLGRRVEISEELADEWSGEGSSMFLAAGERPTVGQLLLGVTTVSANDAAVALALTSVGSLDSWLGLMNLHAAELGLHNTHFGTPNGWPDEGRTYTSARDLALLAEALTRRHPELYRRFFGKSGMTWGEITQANHDPITGRIAGADGIKTGFTRQSGYNFLGSAERNGRRLVVVVAGAPSARLRDDTARKLVEWGFTAFGQRHLLDGGTQVGTALVQDGSLSEVSLETQRNVMASLPAGTDADATLTVRYRGPLPAPIAEGQEIASLLVSIAGQDPYEVPLVAGEDVGKANPFQRVLNSLRKALS